MMLKIDVFTLKKSIAVHVFYHVIVTKSTEIMCYKEIIGFITEDCKSENFFAVTMQNSCMIACAHDV